jgi:hypothetical protein
VGEIQNHLRFHCCHLVRTVLIFCLHLKTLKHAFISLGHVILVASSAPAVLQKPDTSLGLLVLAIFVMAIGAGCVL